MNRYQFFKTMISLIPVFTYTGDYTYIDDGNGNWRIKFTTSGTLTFTKLLGNIDLFLVGAGGGGYGEYSGGGGGGYTATHLSVPVLLNTGYPIVVGAGVTQSDGGNTTGFSYTANGGKVPSTGGGFKATGGNGGSGGGGYNVGDGGSNGSNGQDGSSPADGTGGVGQGTTTKEFGESTGTLYSGGGAANGGTAGSGGGGATDSNGATNTGGGGGGGSMSHGATSGGSGIVVIRNAR